MSLASDFLHQKKKKLIGAWHDHMPHYIYQDSTILAPVVFFTDRVQTALWAVWADQHA